MNTYEYKARTEKGKIFHGTIECGSEQEFYKRLEEKQLYCIEMKQKADRLAQKKQSKWKPKEIGLFCREFAIMLSAGMNMISALQLLYERAHKPHQKTCYMLLLEEIAKGDTLYEAMRRQRNVFPNMLLSMILAGETSGKIDTVMEKMAVYYEKEADLRTKLTNAMIYPIVLICITFGVIILLFTFVLPRFFSLFEGKEVPGITKFFMNVSYFMTNYWYVLLLIVVLVVIAVHWLQRSEKFHAQTDAYVLKIPVVGKLMEKLIIARFANAMNILYSSGITIVESLKIAIGTVGNMYVAKKLTNVNELIEKGISMSEAMEREGLFDNMIWSMIQIGEESGNLESMFYKLSDYYSKESESATQKMMAIMEPLVLVVIAMVIAVVIASVLMPIYSMYKIA